MMQKGSQNIPSVLRFRDHVEGLSLLQINAFSSLGKILLQTVAKLDISPILIGAWFPTDSKHEDQLICSVQVPIVPKTLGLC